MNSRLDRTSRSRSIHRGAGLALGLAVGGLFFAGPAWANGEIPRVWRQQVDRVVDVYAPTALPRLMPHLEQAGINFPPFDVVLLATKRERRLELWARNDTASDYRFVRDYDIKKTSGDSGPKLREGDLQVPEGIYEIDALNPHSRFHLSMHINYPNEFDRRNAWLDGRSNLGGQIFIHGNELSVGCLAMGDSVIEELFVLFATLGPQRNRVVIAPHDPRYEPLDAAGTPNAPWWLPELYTKIEAEFDRFR